MHANRGNFQPQHFTQIINKTNNEIITQPSTICIDETIFPTKIKSPAASFIKRKPHKHGVVCWISCIELPNNNILAYSCCCRDEEHLHWPVFNIVYNLISELPRDKDEQFHFVFDSYFAVGDPLTFITSMGDVYTCSSKVTKSNKEIWNAISRKLTNNTGRVCVTPGEEENKFELWTAYADDHLMKNRSTAYQQHQKNPPNPPQPIPKPIQHYREYFNLVDLFNRNFDKNRWPHVQKEVHDLIFDSLLHIVIINSWAIYSNINREVSMEQFMEILSNELLQ